MAEQTKQPWWRRLHRIHLRLRVKVVLFFIAYSIAFYYFRESSYYNYRFLSANLDSIPGFISQSA